ncbi:hypothetical protein [Rhizobium alvei]|uniref:Sulfotransferase family protein n=1 Tax=Rhizobium alvei TaxID=1132659 RepID=A0ABT8YGI7_9HYPH|nr:hypothetical protein [Rhizobium alvei]MDO6962772.1 hypothetical protein [Rhizobium alvei]
MLVIHVGPRKTGTTYLQNNFHRNRAELIRRGWFYPQVSLGVQSAHHDVAASRDEIRKGQGPMVDRLRRAARKAAKLGTNIFLSSEAFRTWEAEDYGFLARTFGESRAMIVYTLRDPVSLLHSVWGETVKTGRTHSLPEFVAANCDKALRSANLNAMVQLKPIIDRPELDLIVLDYEALRSSGADLYTSFCLHALGLDGMQPQRTRPANSSYSVELTEYIRLLARHLGDYTEDKSLMFARRFEHCHSPAEIAEIEALVRDSGADARGQVALDRSEPWFLALERAASRALRSYLRPTHPEGRLFPQGVTFYACYDIDRLEDIAAIATWRDRSAERMRNASTPWKKSGIMRAWRHIKRRFWI